MKALGLDPMEKVLMPAFTFVAVPSSIVHAGGTPVLVNVTKDLYIDVDHLKDKIDSTGSKILLLSYMRGHFPDIDKIIDICKQKGVKIIEDCAHA